MIGRAAIVLVTLAAGGCTRQSAVPIDMADVRVEQRPDQESWDLDLLMSEDGKPRLRLRAPYMTYFDRPDSTYMLLTGSEGSDSLRVLGTVYDERGDTTATFEADRMTWYDKNRRMEARGRVVVTAVNGRRLESEFLEWLEAERSVQTPGYARITLEDGLMEGYGLVAREDLEEVRLSNVTGHITVTDP